MHFIHIANWHFGQSLHDMHRLGDQRYVLDQLVALIRDTHPDTLVNCSIDYLIAETG